MGTFWAHLGTIRDHESQFKGIKKPLQPFELSRYLAVFHCLWLFFKLVGRRQSHLLIIYLFYKELSNVIFSNAPN